jgi:hypothetical protein
VAPAQAAVAQAPEPAALALSLMLCGIGIVPAKPRGVQRSSSLSSENL